MTAALIRQNRCEKCAHQMPIPQTADLLECREGPPTVSILLMPSKQGQQPQTISAFPQVKREHWCGRFRPFIVGMQ